MADKGILQNPDRELSDVALIASTVACALSAIFALLRTGFGVDARASFAVLGLALFLLNFPAAWRFASLRVVPQMRGIHEFGAAAGFLLTLLLGLGDRGGNARMVPIAMLALAGLSINLKAALDRGSPWKVGGGAMLSGLLTLWIAGVSWGTGFLNPLYLENLSLHGGTEHIDTLFHSSLSNMLRTYGAASVGLDGIPTINYHLGSHWLFARWATLTDLSTIDFYQLGYPVVVGSFFVASFLWMVHAVRRVWAHESPPMSGALHSPVQWVALFVALTGFLPMPAMNGVGVWASGPLLSESYGVALVILFLLVSLAADFWTRAKTETSADRATAPFDLFFLLLVVPFGTAALGLAKVSMMAVIFPAACYALLRVKQLRTRWVYLALVLSAIAFVLTVNFVLVRGQNSGSMALFSFMRSYLPAPWWPFFITIQFLWSWLYIFVRLRDTRVNSRRELITAVRSGRILDVEIIALVSVLGLLPGVVLAVGSDAFYFSDVQRWLSLAFLLGYAPLMNRLHAKWSSFRSGGLFGLGEARLLFLFIAIPVLLNVAFTMLHWSGSMVRTNLETRREVQVLAGHTDPVSILVGAKRALKETVRGRVGAFPEFWRREPGTLFGEATMSAGMRKAKSGAIVSALRDLDTVPITEKRRALLFIPQSFERFWQMVPDPKLCSYAGFVGPALSGMALLDGVPPLGCKVALGYGLRPYRDRLELQAADGPELCTRVQAMGFERLYVVQDGSADGHLISARNCLNR
ncbi:MAG: hypothetical protein H0U64_11285 [Gemmatimonadaceae bacterium]|nr:hypothetical protein [Gemmatimonadaceae bacterium]